MARPLFGLRRRLGKRIQQDPNKCNCDERIRRQRPYLYYGERSSPAASSPPRGMFEAPSEHVCVLRLLHLLPETDGHWIGILSLSHEWRQRMAHEGPQSRPDEIVMTVKEVAAFLRLSEATIYRLAKRGRIPGIKIGGAWRFRRRLVEEWMSKETDRMLVAANPSTV
jgi:excisionase family DNA binding protein